MRNVIIVGSGPAGLTAAIYTSRANLHPIIFEGHEPGGQLTLTTTVENFPGFPDGILGPDLIEAMRLQALRFGTEMARASLIRVDLSRRPFRVWTEEQEYQCKVLIIATGASAKLLGLESEKRLIGHGVSTCATCDGFFFRGQEVAVVGGGDSALEEGLFLSKYASKVTIIHRRDSLRASKILQDRAFRNERIRFLWNTVVDAILENNQGRVSGLRLRSTVNEQGSHDIPIDGIFVAIGHQPNTKLFEGQLKLDETGYIMTCDGSSTSIEGVFVAGDAHDSRYRQAITAAGSGCRAAIDAVKYLESLH
jgi:thioredoxin reductase (NADPH)